MIGMPSRYMDTSEEMMSLKDVNDTISLINEVVKASIKG
jgi:putative aminopeptidase FrvX